MGERRRAAAEASHRWFRRRGGRSAPRPDAADAAAAQMLMMSAPQGVYDFGPVSMTPELRAVIERGTAQDRSARRA